MRHLAMGTMLMMAVTKGVSQAERDAAVATKPEIASETGQQQEEDIIELEELAALYISVGGRDPRAVKLFEAAKDAGRIDNDGNWVGEE